MKRIYLICCIMVFLLGGCRNRSSPQQLSLSDESEEINSFTSSSEELLLEEEYYHYDLFERVYDSGVNYETIAHRNFRCVVVIVTPKEELPRLENIVETYCKAHRENANRIDIKCMAEESL